jgi:hypothetical protein
MKDETLNERDRYIVAIECLKRIANYQEPEDLLENSEDEYGVEGAEGLQMAYENVLYDAQNVLKRLGEDKDK